MGGFQELSEQTDQLKWGILGSCSIISPNDVESKRGRHLVSSDFHINTQIHIFCMHVPYTQATYKTHREENTMVLFIL